MGNKKDIYDLLDEEIAALDISEEQKKALKKLNYVNKKHLTESIKQNQQREKAIDYSKYGEGFTRDFINTMLKDERFARVMARTFTNEGGYTNHKNDRGGETNYGISAKIYPNENIKNMTKERANAIYYRDYWIKHKINQLPDGYADVVFDNGVVQGQPTAIRNLQKALGIHVDGIIGTETLDATRNIDYNMIRENFINSVNQVEDKYQKNHPEQKVFEKGHRNRYKNY